MISPIVRFRGINISATSWPEAVSTIVGWCKESQPRYVCACNVHSVIVADQDLMFRRAVNSADMATPDGAPLAWVIRANYQPLQERVSGPDLMLKLCDAAKRDGLRIFLYGNTDEVLSILKRRLEEQFPGIAVVGTYSPPFRALTEEEDAEIVDMINAAKPHMVFVSLGCPKQEIWMMEHRERIPSVLLGVGAAFDFYAGTVKRAPEFMQRYGLEWLYRLISDPRRLARRYLPTNTKFVFYWLTRQLHSVPDIK